MLKTNIRGEKRVVVMYVCIIINAQALFKLYLLYYKSLHPDIVLQWPWTKKERKRDRERERTKERERRRRKDETN